ncbi:hypothetical protein G9A89_010570 [Geosiphon pyriformis]|nr:hypothetical protein G9A89_010570 [Geosiphon pyriformis]
MTDTRKSDDYEVFTLNDQFGKQNDSWYISLISKSSWITLPKNTLLIATLEGNNVIIYFKNLPYFSKKGPPKKSKHAVELRISQRNPMEIANDLDTMIRNKWITPISIHSHTEFLDETYGFQVKREGNSFAIVSITLILVDVVIDIIFIINNGKDVKDLYLPSVLAVYIVITEITINDEYLLWFRQHAKPAALFTLLYAADIDALNLYSKYANFDI